MIARIAGVSLCWLTIPLLVVGAGCAESETTRDDSDSPAPASSKPFEDDEAATTETEASSPGGAGEHDAAGVTVRIADEKDFSDLLKQYEGNIVLVDFWALWCGPCKELFPHTVKLYERYKEQGLVVISVNLDDPGEEQRVLDFLASHKATFDNLISKYDVGPKSFEVFEIETGNVPYYKLYDRTGNLHTTLGHTQDSIKPSDIDQAVEHLLDDA